MATSWLNRFLKKSRPVSRSGRKQPKLGRFTPNLETLGDRVMPSVTAVFTPGAGTLTVLGDNLDNTIVVSRDAAGQIFVNGGAVAIVGGTPTVANTTSISVFGLNGNDTISLNEVNGPLPSAQLFGGNGTDTLTGGSGADLLFGQAGNDVLLGKGGADFLFGGAGDDVLTGGTGDDQVFGEAGNDRMIWNPGEGSDLNEGGAGIDTVEINGGNASENFTITANGARVRFDRVSPGPFFVDIGTSENLVLNANGGDDVITAGNGLATLIQLNLDGGAGNDTITGGDGNDRISGGDGNDLINGGRGNDTVFLGAGDDTFVWNPGDGSDVVEGEGGHDTLQFNGSNLDEKINLSANGSRLLLTRDVGNVTMDVNGIEQVNVVALGGADTITVGDLSGTDVTAVNIDLASTPGSGTGDGAADTVIVNGTNLADNIQIQGSGANITVTGLQATVNVTGSEGANDHLVVFAQGGDDGVSADGLAATTVQLTIDGGTGNDTITGGDGADMLFGGDGNDLIEGGRGNDQLFGGAGDDTFTWDPGDGSDTIEGGDGTDLMLFFGANVAEKFDVSANGTHVRFTRDIGNIVMDLNGVEHAELRALGGADSVVVNDLTGTDLTRFDVDLRGPNGDPDGVVDTVTVNGTLGNDSFGALGSSGGINVFGLHTEVNIFFQEPDIDQLTLRGLAGDDIINAAGLRADSIQLSIDGGDGNDTLTGGDGNDQIIGGRGADLMFGGAGDDAFVWNPGDGSDTIEGGAGFNTMVFNGAAANESFEISANGERVRFTRDVGGIVMDLNDVQSIDVNPLGGTDKVTINDLSGTDVTEININLAATLDSTTGDGAADTVIVNGTNDADVMVVTGDANGVTVAGLAAQPQIHITGADSADRLNLSAMAGDDVVQASGLSAGVIQLTADGGDGDDALIGSPGNDTLTGGAGDDVLFGNGGQDVLDAAPGNDTVIP